MPTHLSQKSVINPPIKTLQLFPQKEKHPSDYKIQHSYIVQLKKSQTNTQTNNNIVQIERKKKHGRISNVTRFCSSSSLCSKRPTSSWLCSLFPLSIQHSLCLCFLLCHPLCTHMDLLR